jgi:tripartite-type tricarboxylate transporter receptor subunit TctC
MVAKLARRLAVAMTAAVAVVAAPAMAQTYPTKAIHFVVPYTPGGIIDAAARVIAPKLTESWGQQVIIENKPGGSAVIGTQYVVKSAPDGYTFVLATLGDFTVNPTLLKDIPYSVEKDLAPVAILTSIPTVLAVNAETTYKTVADLIAAAKAQPGRLSYSTPGNGAINHITMESFALNTGTKFQHIPYKGGAPATTAVAAGDVPVGMLGFTAAIPFMRSGKIRVLATATAKRVESMPELPSLSEGGYLKFDGSNWVGMMAPKATPAAIVERMNAELGKILAMPDVRDRLAATGGTPVPGSVASFAARIKAETAAFKDVVEKAQIEAQ